MMPMMHFIGNFGYVAVCVVGAALALYGAISFGVIVAFMLYIRLFTQPLSQMAQAANNLQRTAAAGERVFELLDEAELEDERHKSRRLKDIKGHVEFRQVKFGITRKPVIHAFSANIEPGKRLLLSGRPVPAKRPLSTC